MRKPIRFRSSGRHSPVSIGGRAAPQNSPLRAVHRLPGDEYSAQGCGVLGTTCWLLAPRRPSVCWTSAFQAARSAAMRTLPVPFTAMAFRRFDPNTPPTPPAECEKPLMSEASRHQVLARLADGRHLRLGPISWQIELVAW